MEPVNPEQLQERFLRLRADSLAKRRGVPVKLVPDSQPPVENLKGDLRLLQIAGAIKGQADMDFYSALLSAFDARYAGIAGTISDPPPEPVRLPANWSNMLPAERLAFLQADLEAAVGKEYIERNPQPPVSRAGTRSRRKRNS